LWRSLGFGSQIIWKTIQGMGVWTMLAFINLLYCKSGWLCSTLWRSAAQKGEQESSRHGPISGWEIQPCRHTSTEVLALSSPGLHTLLCMLKLLLRRSAAFGASCNETSLPRQKPPLMLLWRLD
jgi:hypothetical protein